MQQPLVPLRNTEAGVRSSPCSESKPAGSLFPRSPLSFQPNLIGSNKASSLWTWEGMLQLTDQWAICHKCLTTPRGVKLTHRHCGDRGEMRFSKITASLLGVTELPHRHTLCGLIIYGRKGYKDPGEWSFAHFCSKTVLFSDSSTINPSQMSCANLFSYIKREKAAFFSTFIHTALQSSYYCSLNIARQPTALMFTTPMSMNHSERPPTMFNEGTEVPGQPGLLASGLILDQHNLNCRYLHTKMDKNGQWFTVVKGWTSPNQLFDGCILGLNGAHPILNNIYHTHKCKGKD